MMFNRIMVKHYRGQLFGRLCDLNTAHTELAPQHRAGSLPETCRLCGQINRCQELLKIVEQLKRASDHPQPKICDHVRHYYYVADTSQGTKILVRSVSRLHAIEILAKSAYHDQLTKPLHQIGYAAVRQFLIHRITFGQKLAS